MPLENFLELFAVLVEDFFFGAVFAPCRGLLNPFGLLCRGRPCVGMEKVGDIIPIKPNKEGERPDKEGNEDEEQDGAKPSPLFLSSFMCHEREENNRRRL